MENNQQSNFGQGENNRPDQDLPGSQLMNVCSILMIIFAVAGIIAAVVSLFGSMFAAFMLGPLLIVAILGVMFSLAYAILSLMAGLSGHKNRWNASAASTLMSYGILICAFEILGFIFNSIARSRFSFWSLIFSLIIPGLYLYAAYQMQKTTGQQYHFGFQKAVDEVKQGMNDMNQDIHNMTSKQQNYQQQPPQNYQQPPQNYQQPPQNYQQAPQNYQQPPQNYQQPQQNYQQPPQNYQQAPQNYQQAQQNYQPPQQTMTQENSTTGAVPVQTAQQVEIPVPQAEATAAETTVQTAQQAEAETAKGYQAFSSGSIASSAIWTCPGCGKIGNTGKFCSQCGTKKPE